MLFKKCLVKLWIDKNGTREDVAMKINEAGMEITMKQIKSKIGKDEGTPDAHNLLSDEIDFQNDL